MNAFALALFGLGFVARALAQDIPPPAAPASDAVARALFTTGIAGREPTDRITSLDNGVRQVYFFTELTGLEGKPVAHKWEYAGEVKAAVTFQVGAPRWRVWSSKTLDPGWTGTWTVSVVDASGATLAQETLTYQPDNR
jgi:hypothetical protein